MRELGSRFRCSFRIPSYDAGFEVLVDVGIVMKNPG